ncbi:MAG TPA: DUF2442 domain-containing protein [Candidatus Acidoferrum sp.]|nr:DUF2442 domain-containing protein [Candidatus Acidoferrum sp.]
MSKLIKATPGEDYTLLLEFEQGNQILYDMKPLLSSLPYRKLRDYDRFKNLTLEDKAVCWPDPSDRDEAICPLRLTVDNILFAIRG